MESTSAEIVTSATAEVPEAVICKGCGATVLAGHRCDYCGRYAGA